MKTIASCDHTGLSIPECSCIACLEAQIREHSPALLEARDGDE